MAYETMTVSWLAIPARNTSELVVACWIVISIITNLFERTFISWIIRNWSFEKMKIMKKEPYRFAESKAEALSSIKVMRLTIPSPLVG